MGCVLPLLAADAASAYEPRVPDGYYGIASPGLSVLARDGDPQLATHVASIRAAEFDFVRSTVDWRQVEPLLGAEGARLYDWAATDRLVRNLAEHDLELVPSIIGTPTWAKALGALSCEPIAAISETHAPDFGALAGAVVRRYGQGGRFWAANPDLKPQPIARVEIWNEPNWTGFWCPGPQPERFAASAAAAARAVRAADPQVETVLGGLVVAKEDQFFSNGHIQGMATDTFLARMVAAEPELTELLDQVALHLYHPDPERNMSQLAWFRRILEQVGLDRSEILITEFGWHTSGSDRALDEQARAAAFADFVSLASRTDCGVRGMAAHDWFTPESDPANPEHWFGIADPQTSTLHPAGAAYRDAAALFEGRGDAPAPRATVRICNRPLPDQDGDGATDETDDYPLDADRSTGSAEVPQEGPFLRAPFEPQLDASPARWSAQSVAEFSYSANGAAYYECRLDREDWTPCGVSKRLNGLVDGRHVFDVRAVDPIELVSPVTHRTWSVDTRAPKLALRKLRVRGRRASVRFRVRDNSGAFTTTCRIDRRRWSSCSSLFRTGRLRYGKHRVTVRASDRAGNVAVTRAKLRVRR